MIMLLVGGIIFLISGIVFIIFPKFLWDLLDRYTRLKDTYKVWEYNMDTQARCRFLGFANVVFGLMWIAAFRISQY